MSTTEIFTPEFVIFKQGVTDAPVTISSCSNMPFDRDFKLAKYKFLGYTVTDLSGNEI